MRHPVRGELWLEAHSVPVREPDGSTLWHGVASDITARKQAEQERQKFVLLAESSTEFIGMCDLDFQPLHVNPAGVRMVGLPDRDAACRVKVQDYFFPEDRPFITDEFFPRVLREGHGEVEIRLRHFQTGEAIWMSYYLFQVRDTRGAVVGWATVSRDITERKRADTALRESEERFAAAFRANPAGVALSTLAEGRFIDVNGAFLKMFGLTREQVIGRRAVELGVVVTAEERRKIVEEVRRTGSLRDLEMPFQRADGSTCHTLRSVERLVLGGEECLLTLIVDTTARRRAEAALQEREAQLSLVYENVNDVLFVVAVAPDGDFRFSSVNRRFLEATGLAENQVVGRRVADALPVSAHAVVLGNYREAIRTRRPVTWEEVSEHPAGWKCGVVTVAPVFDAQGRGTQLIGTVHAITERKRSEQKLAESSEQLRALLARLQRVREEERTRVSREIHDELGQLLTGLKMDVRWLERKLSAPGLPPALHPLLDRAVAASELADATIATVQKIAAELRSGTLDNLGLAAALHHRARGFQERTGIPCVLVAAEACPELPPTIANELFYICQEALTNVTRHAHAAHVEIHLRAEGDAVMLEVGDDGVGMAAAELLAPRSLGLIGMRERAVQCGGTLAFTPNEPQGTRVMVRVPQGVTGDA